MKRLSGWDAMLIYTETDNIPTHTLKIAVIDVSAIEVDSSDERFDIIIEGSNSSSFASGNCALACMPWAAPTGRTAGRAGTSFWRRSVAL